MTLFEYKAIDRTGQAIQGRVEAESSAAAVQLLSEQGRFVDKITECCPEEKFTVEDSPPVSGLSRKLKLSGKVRSEFIRQMATALQAQLPILTVLKVIGQQNQHPSVKQLCRELEEIIRSGKSLSKGFALFPRIFDPLHISLVAVGETAGDLGRSVCQLAELDERALETRNEIITAAMYPLFVLLLGLMSVVIVVTYILPQILNTLITDTSVLPWPTRMIIHISNFLQRPAGITLMVILFGGSIFLFYWRKSRWGRVFWDGLKLRVPLLRGVMVKWAIARFARTLGTLTAGGVNILEALKIVRNCLGNVILSREVDRITQQVRTGTSLAEAMHKSRQFPPLLIQIVSVGEETGKLPEMLIRTAEALDKDTNMAVRRFMALFPAILITILAGIIGFIVAATLMPIVQMQTAIPGL